MSVPPELNFCYMTEREIYEREGNKSTFIGIEYLIRLSSTHELIQVCRSRKTAELFLELSNRIEQSKNA